MLIVLGKSHTLARGGRFSPKLATYELHELDEYRRSRQQRGTTESDEDMMEQLQDYDREVNACRDSNNNSNSHYNVCDAVIIAVNCHCKTSASSFDESCMSTR